MANRTPGTLLRYSVAQFEQAIQLTARASIWQSQLRHFHAARFNNLHFNQIVELAFMKSYLTWEGFIEEAFILYLLGKSAPNGYLPKRHAIPLNRQHAVELLASDARYTDWTAPDRIVNRATRFFRRGAPFVDIIRPQTNLLNNLKTIRNAISHDSDEATERFNALVRNELTFLPHGTTPGSFLATLRRHSSPPQTYFHYYTECIRSMAQDIIPS
jgi:hypothetical protein